MGDKSSLVEKFKGLETKEKYLVIASLVTAIGFVLPWVDVPLVGSVNALHGWLVIVFLLSLVTAGLVLYEQKKYALIGTFVVGGLLLLKLFGLFVNYSEFISCYKLSSSLENCRGFISCCKFCFEHGNPVFSSEVLNLLKLGFYVTYLGAIAMVYFGFKLRKKK